MLRRIISFEHIIMLLFISSRYGEYTQRIDPCNIHKVCDFFDFFLSKFVTLVNLTLSIGLLHVHSLMARNRSQPPSCSRSSCLKCKRD